MSILLTPTNPPPHEASETINISNGEWCAICALAKAFGIDVTPSASVGHATSGTPQYSPDTLRAVADRVEQLKRAPEWLRWLADNGGANLG